MKKRIVGRLFIAHGPQIVSLGPSWAVLAHGSEVCYYNLIRYAARVANGMAMLSFTTAIRMEAPWSMQSVILAQLPSAPPPTDAHPPNKLLLDLLSQIVQNVLMDPLGKLRASCRRKFGPLKAIAGRPGLNIGGLTVTWGLKRMQRSCEMCVGSPGSLSVAEVELLRHDEGRLCIIVIPDGIPPLGCGPEHARKKAFETLKTQQGPSGLSPTRP